MAASSLLNALMNEMPDYDHPAYLALVTAAAVLSKDPARALAWGQVLTEHTAPPVEAPTWPVPSTLHPFKVVRGTDRCKHTVAGTACWMEQPAAVHRVEQLTEGQSEALARLADFLPQSGWPTSDTDLEELCRLGLIARARGGYYTTASGRAWLEAHPREGGEPE